MKTLDIRRAIRLANELTAELQRLEHRAEADPRCNAGEATDELTQIRHVRDLAIDAKDALLDLEPA